jgi:hypothetical protein
MFHVAEGSVGLRADGLPDALLAVQEPQVIGALGMSLGLAIEHGIPGTKDAVLVPDGVGAGVPAVGTADADIQANSRRFHEGPIRLIPGRHSDNAFLQKKKPENPKMSRDV